jgi:hypothetical protein
MEQAPLTRRELKKFDAILSARVGELVHELPRRDLLAAEQIADQLDEVQRASDRALAVSHSRLKNHTNCVRPDVPFAAFRKTHLESAGNVGRPSISSDSVQYRRQAFCIGCQEE